MNGMLLAAGRGERMEPLSSLIPKPALEVLGRPLLASALDHLLAAGCTTLVVNLHRHAEAVAAAACTAAAGRQPPVFSHEPELLGSAGGITAARRCFAPGPVLVANGDVWASLDLTPLLEAAHPDRLVLGLLPHPDPKRWSAVELEQGGRVRRIVPPGGACRGPSFLFTGFQLLGEEVLAALPPPPAPMGPAWSALIQRGSLYGAILRGPWHEAGTPESYRKLVVGLVGGQSWWHADACVHPGASLVSSAVGAGCTVGTGATLVHAVLTAGARVGDGARLERCVVAGTVDVSPGEICHDLLILPHGRVPLQ